MRLLRQIGIILIIAAIPAIISAFFQLKINDVNPAKMREGEVTLEQVMRWPDILWVDARPEKQFTKDHIPGAIRLNLDEWDALLPEFLNLWHMDVRVVVYCDSVTCDASKEVAERLRDEVDLEQVYILKGGWEAWQQAVK